MSGPTQKLKVLFFLRRVGPYHHARFQAASRLVDLTVVETRSASTEYPWDFEAGGMYALHRLPTASDPESGLHGCALTAAITQAFDRHATDIVVTTGWADQEYHSVILEAAKRRVPRVVISDSRYEDEPRKFYKEFIKKLILRNYSGAIVAGAAARNYMRRLGFPVESIFHPWDVVDNDYFRSTSSGVAFHDRYFLCVSRFIPKKNLERFLASYAGYRRQGGTRKLVLLGSGELESRLRRLAETLSLGTSLEMPGFAQYEELKKYYSNAFCLLLPSLTDQWGLVVNEAMASGLPVAVSSNCGCAADLVEESKNGLIFDPFDMEEMTNAFIEMDRLTETEWNSMSSKSRSTIENWGLSQFGEALRNAAQLAIATGPRSITPFIHKLLAR
jgi:glycosyltransferase involved in cell wall biosynthesis